MTTMDDDILLSAYLDGELPAGEADALSERLAREPALMQRLEALRGADTATRRVFASLDERPMPARVLELLGAGDERRTAGVVPMAGRRRAQRAEPAPRTPRLPLALAAGLALVAGFLVSNVLRETPGIDAGLGVDLGNGGLVAANSDLHALLERGASGEPRAFGDGVAGTVALTFADRAGDWCRELVVSGGAEGLYGVACRRGGDWRMEVISYGDAPGASGPYRPAGGAAPGAVQVAVDGLIGPGDPLGAEEESLVISSGWEKSPE